MNTRATVNRYPVAQGWTLNVLPYGAKSPMKDHRAFETAADDENKEFWVATGTVAVYGLDSVIAACKRYVEALNKRTIK